MNWSEQSGSLQGLVHAALIGPQPATAARRRGCSGCYRYHNPVGKEVPDLVGSSIVDSVEATGILGMIGVSIPEDPGAQDTLAKKGQITFDFGKSWFKGQRLGTGQCSVKTDNRRLRDLIHNDNAKPSMIIAPTDAGQRGSSNPTGPKRCCGRLLPDVGQHPAIALAPLLGRITPNPLLKNSTSASQMSDKEILRYL